MPSALARSFCHAENTSSMRVTMFRRASGVCASMDENRCGSMGGNTSLFLKYDRCMRTKTWSTPSMPRILLVMSLKHEAMPSILALMLGVSRNVDMSGESMDGCPISSSSKSMSRIRSRRPDRLAISSSTDFLSIPLIPAKSVMVMPLPTGRR